nr:hypothetical protein BaRGS_020451 [Batillaria attramentaria]
MRAATTLHLMRQWRAGRGLVQGKAGMRTVSEVAQHSLQEHPEFRRQGTILDASEVSVKERILRGLEQAVTLAGDSDRIPCPCHFSRA